MSEIRHVIVQASGKGTRMGYLTENKPKALVSIFGLPLLYHLYKVFPKATFYIVGHYKYEILEKYLQVYPPKFKYFLIRADTHGSCEGLEKARELIKKNGGNHFAITWCDLFYTQKIKLPSLSFNYIGLTNEFKCRWSFENNSFVERESDKGGIIGFFFFGKPELLPPIPESGEFVRFLKDKGVALKPFFLDGVKEIGTLQSFNEITSSQNHTRFFNQVVISNSKVIKRVRDKNFSKLLADEVNWYKFVYSKKYSNIPFIYNFKPLTLAKIDGKHPFDLPHHTENSVRTKIVESILIALKDLHNLGSVPSLPSEIEEVYINKTKKRILKIAPLLPDVEAEYYKINGRKVKNLLNPKYIAEIDKISKKLSNTKIFTVIHGDPTFSNTLIENKTGKVIFIDPRGYFGNMKIYGDPRYDFAKVYYSAIGNYDQFNQRKFRISISDEEITLKIESNKFEDTQKVFSQMFSARELKDIKILHALIWLSLAGYVLDDVDSILGAYFHGLELFEEVQKDE